MSTPADRLDQLAAELGLALRSQHLMLATAESCTAGGVAYAVTLAPGSSQWFDRGFISYSNEAKIQMLGVAPAYLRDFGAVSEPVARAMAVTGIAGPDGGTVSKPVGTVCFAWAIRRDATQAAWVKTDTRALSGERSAVRTESILVALETLVGLLKQRQDV